MDCIWRRQGLIVGGVGVGGRSGEYGLHLEGQAHMVGTIVESGGEVVGTDGLHLEGKAHIVGGGAVAGGEVVGTDGLHLEGSHGWRRCDGWW